MRPYTTLGVLIALVASTWATMTLDTPPLGENGAITGTVSGLPQPATAYKVRRHLLV
jgi:hypothetical protein